MGHFTPKGTLPGNGVPQILCPSLAASPPGRLGWDCMPWDEALQFFPHSNGVAQGSQMTSGFTEGKEMPIPEQTSTTAGGGGSCSNAVPATAPGTGTVGTPTYSPLLLMKGLLRLSMDILFSLAWMPPGSLPSSFSLQLLLSLEAGCSDTGVFLVSILQTCNLPRQERVLARLLWAMLSPFPAPRLWTSFSFPPSDETFTVNELVVCSPSLCSPRGRAPQGRSLQHLLQKRFLVFS